MYQCIRVHKGSAINNGSSKRTGTRRSVRGKGSADSMKAARTDDTQKRGEPETESEAKVEAGVEALEGIMKYGEEAAANEERCGSKRRLITADRVCCQDRLGYVERQK